MKPRSAEVSTGDSNKYSDGASVDDEFLGDSDTADEKQPPNPKTAAGGVGQLELPRLVRRNRPYSQSGNRLKVEHNQGFKVFLLLRHDWFHVILRLPTERSLLCLLTVWTALVLIFASLYVAVDNHDPNVSCGLGPVGSPIDFGGAFSFSLETCTTVGYGLPSGVNSFFSNCPQLQIVIYFQMTWSMLFNAFLFAFFYSRLAKSESRGAQVVLSDKAIVTLVEGQIRFQVRVYDIDAANPVVEAHIRMYAVTKDRPVPRQLRLLQPNDELGAMLFLSVPAVVSHHIDLYSLLHPPQATPLHPSGLVLRQADSATGGREEVVCPVCGESYGTLERWRNHVQWNRIAEEKCGYPVVGTHLSLQKSDFTPAVPEPFTATRNMAALQDYFAQEISEVICVVEGIEPFCSGTFVSLQSYQLADIVFHSNARFRPCVEAVYREKKSNDDPSFIRVDLDRFHGIDIEERPIHRSPDGRRSIRTHDGFFTNKDETLR